MTDELATRVEASLEKDQEGLEEDLPGILEDLDGQSEEFVREHPELMADITTRMQEMDTATFISENPETAARFQDLLWSGVTVMSERNDEVQESIQQDVTVNFTADDAPMEGHLLVDEDAGTVTGGSGHVDDADLHITGPADVLVGLVTGEVDPIQGFMQQQYEMDGPVAKGTSLAPVMNSLTEQV